MVGKDEVITYMRYYFVLLWTRSVHCICVLEINEKKKVFQVFPSVYPFLNMFIRLQKAGEQHVSRKKTAR